MPAKKSSPPTHSQDNLSHQRKLSSREDLVAASICGVFFLFWMTILYLKHLQSVYYDWDLALSLNILWSLSQGHMTSSLLGTHFLANHANYIAFLIAPLIRIFPSPLTLIFLKVLSFSLASFVLFKIGRRSLGFIPAVALMGAYFIYPANISAIWFDFDFENFLALAFLLLFYFFLEGRVKPFLWACFFTCLIKENAPLIVISFGLFAFVAKKEKRLFWSGIPIVLGAIFFLGSVLVVIPHFRKDFLMPHAYLDSYAYIQSSATELSGLSFWASKIFHGLWNDININFFSELFYPLIFSLLSPGILLIGLPLFLQNFLSSKFPQHTVYFHYAASLAPFIFVATAVALTKIKEKIRERTSHQALIATVMFCLFNVVLYQQTFFSQKYFSRFQRQDLQRAVDAAMQRGFVVQKAEGHKKRILQRVSSADAVIATFEFLPYLAARDKIFSFHNFLENRNPITGTHPYILSPDLDYALIDFNDRWISSDADRRKLAQARKFLQDDWSVVQAAGDSVLFSRKGAAGEKVLSFGAQEEGNVIAVRIDDSPLELRSVQVGAWDSAHRVLVIDVFWRCWQRTKKSYGMIFILQRGIQKTIFYAKEIGYGLWPVSTWEEGVCVQEKVWLPVPKMPAGEYLLKAFVLDLSQYKGGKESRSFHSQPILLGKIFLTSEHQNP